MIKAINPALSLRSYLEGKADLTLAKLQRILLSHYQEKTATQLYHQLSSTVQKSSEKPQDFFDSFAGFEAEGAVRVSRVRIRV